MKPTAKERMRSELGAIWQEIHNLKTLNTENAAWQLSTRIGTLEKETRRILAGLAQRIDALSQPKIGFFRKLFCKKGAKT